jgi:hypothetical protein
MFVYLSIKDAHDRQYNYMKITIFTLIGMIRLIGFNIQDIQIHNNFDKYSDPCNRLRESASSTVVYLTQIYNYYY